MNLLSHRWASVALTCLAFLQSPAPLARDATGTFEIKGVGALPCRDYLDAAEVGGSALEHYGGYVTGYISAYNEHVPDTYELIPWQSIDSVMMLLATRCRIEPTLDFGIAMSHVAKYFSEGRLSARRGKKVPVGAGPDSVELNEFVYERLETILLERGYLQRPGGDVAAALRAAQEDLGLAVSGRPDQITLLRLFYGSVPQGEND